MRTNKFVLTGLLLLCASCAAAQDAPTTAPSQLAFPTAEGFGRFTVGGRGGKVVFVTNLNDSGAGSLREAVEKTPGPRTVVFCVSGTIDLQTRITINEPYLTIAGQTAPGDGICIKRGYVLNRTHDVIVRYLRVRPGDLQAGGFDALSSKGGRNVIFDHCSVSWSNDELCSTTEAQNVTVQWCFITEALHNAGHTKGNHGYGALMQGDGVTYHHNLLAHNRSRVPRPQSGYSQFINNVVYDWNAMAGYAARDNKFRLNYVANYLKPGPSTVQHRDLAFHTGGPDTFMYVKGNVLEGVVAEGQNDRPIIRVRDGGNLVDEPFDFPAIKTDAATAAFQRVLTEAGATLPKRDAVDQRVAQQVLNGTGKHIDSQNEVGGWPELKFAQAPSDSDNDGMTDEWEHVHGVSDINSDPDGDGYTNLEEFLNSTDPLAKD